MKIIARNLSRETTEDELTHLFEPYGELRSCDLVMDKESGKSKGFGFAEMPNLKEAKAAIYGLNSQVVRGSKIRVKKTNK